MTTANTLRPWESLEQTGVQDFTYADVSRTDLHPLFGHAPLRVLDIGCASGAVGLGIKQHFPNVYVLGCEPDLNAAKIAQTRLDHVITQPIRDWDKNNLALIDSIDTVMLLDVLEHMYNPWAELKFLSQHLPKDTQIIVSLPNIGHLSTFAQLHNGYWKYEPYGIKDITHLRFFTEYEMTRMFYQTGFKIDQKVYLATPTNLQQFDQYPIRINLNETLTMQVRDQNHWMQLNAIQLGFRLSIADDASLSASELDLRHGPHRA